MAGRNCECYLRCMHALNEQIVSTVKRWLETVILGYTLCPFARKVYEEKTIRYATSTATTEEELLKHLHDELELLVRHPEIETTLLIHPEVLQDFLDYNDFLSLADDLVDDLRYEGVFQVASFHPQYQFADTEPDDAENYTNRSPYPILHLLREESVTKAIESHPDIDSVPVRNQTLMRDLGAEQMKAILVSCLAGPQN